jgi:uroporphyrinogen-III synthase
MDPTVPGAAEPRLRGISVLVTRPRERAAELCFLLEDEGAEVVSLPLLELLPPEDERPLRAAAEQIHRYTWIAFPSPAAVESLINAIRQAQSIDRLRLTKIAVVGPGTARAARAAGLAIALESPVRTGAGLADALGPLLAESDEVLIPAAQEGRPDLEDQLGRFGARITRVSAYRTEPAGLGESQMEMLAARPPQLLLFSSPRSAEALDARASAALRTTLQRAHSIAIGPSTAAALEKLGFRVSAVAEHPTSASLVDAAVRALSG